MSLDVSIHVRKDDRLVVRDSREWSADKRVVVEYFEGENTERGSQDAQLWLPESSMDQLIQDFCKELGYSLPPELEHKLEQAALLRKDEERDRFIESFDAREEQELDDEIQF